MLCGRQAIDGDTAQVGPQCAEKLGITQITYLEQVISIIGDTVRVRRSMGHGWEIVEAKTPLLMTVIETANEPRPAAAKRVLRYKRARVLDEVAGEVKQALPEATDAQREEEVSCRAAALAAKGLLVEQWNLDRINADLQRCGLAGSPTKVHRVQSIVLTKQGYTEMPATAEGVQQLIH